MPFPARLDPHRIGPDALAFVETRGWDGWSLRDVAGHLGVSPNALYRHVDGKVGLEIAMGAAAAHALGEALRAVPGAGEPRLVALAERYVEFAMERPHAFAAFVHAKPGPEHPLMGAWFALWTETYGEVARVLPDAPEAAAFAFWALVHGRAELARGPARLAAPTAGLADAVRAMVAGYRVLGEVPSPLPEHVPVRLPPT